MGTAQIAAGLRRATDSTSRVFSFLASCWVSFQAWRKRGRPLDELSSLSNRGLLDIGFTRGEIDRIRGPQQHPRVVRTRL